MEERKPVRNYTAIMAVIVLSVLFMIVGALLALHPDFPVSGFIYVTSGAAIVGGVWLVLRFFMKEEYLSVLNYDFSIGILMIAAGVLLIIQAKALLPYFVYVVGCLLIILGVIVLQFFLMCAFMRGPLGAFINFVFAAAIIALGAAFIVLDTQTLFKYVTYFYLGVMAAGILGILSLVITFLRSVKYERYLNLSARRNLEDEPDTDTYIDISRSRDRNLEDEPFEVKAEIEPNPGTPWNTPQIPSDTGESTEESLDEEKTDMKGQQDETKDIH